MLLALRNSAIAFVTKQRECITGSDVRRKIEGYSFGSFLLLAFLLLATKPQRASAFALLGPFAPWMTQQYDYQDGYSIGGPMDIGQGYRWNVPVVTYGFDPSFTNYFGSNGVMEVESAVQQLNELPPASAIDADNYCLNAQKIKFSAVEAQIVDVKSAALSALLEQMGGGAISFL